VDDVALTESGKSVVVAVLENDYDPENHLLVVSGHTQAEHGEIRLNADNTLTYTAPVDFSGVVYVQYSISDGINAAIATVRIDVMPSVVVNPNVVAETAIGDDHGTEPFSGLSSSPTEGSDDLASSNPVSELSEKEIAEAAKDAEKAAEDAEEAAEKIEKEALKAAEKAAEKEREAIEKAEKAAIKAAEKAAKEAEEAAKKEREAIEKAEKAAKESADDDDD
jgi:molecular chaperone DnaK (HSP70)